MAKRRRNNIVRFPVERTLTAAGVDRSGPPSVIILPVVKVERYGEATPPDQVRGRLSPAKGEGTDVA